MKLYNKKEILPIILILSFFAIGLALWSRLPQVVPTHWGINGQPNGWSSKNFAVFFLPAMMAGIYLLLSFIPIIDPLKKNIETFAIIYYWFKVFFVLFFGGLYLLTLYAGLGHTINIGQYVLWGIALLFFFLGLMMPRIKKNYTIGIRLPWTLHSEVVWDKTHKFGGKIFIALAILFAIASFLPGAWAFSIMITGVILMLVVLIWYSYMEYRKVEKRQG